ncbi:MAG: CDP-alcohol phosphatidyltransferase family protein, partial [Anaerolineales bacterium]|nr:CDP-alcohol phosphatidyltransferase family protein [Anaerolineales bacterium]
MNERPFSPSIPHPDALTRLRRRWGGIALGWLAAWLAGYLALRPIWPHAGRWALLAAPLLGYGLWVVWRHLPQNYRPGERRLLPTLGLGNGLTIFRGLAVALIAGFLFSPWPGGWLAWLPMLLYTTADVADFLDGYAARRQNHATALGAQLDMTFDGLGMLVVSLLAVWYGQLPAWYLLLGLARYLFLLGAWWRQRRGRPLHPLPPSTHRRVFAGFQMGFMSAVLWPILPPAGATIAGTLFAAATAASFLRDWLVTIGRLDPRGAGYRRAQGRLVWLARAALPLLLRV